MLKSWSIGTGGRDSHGGTSIRPIPNTTDTQYDHRRDYADHCHQRADGRSAAVGDLRIRPFRQVLNASRLLAVASLGTIPEPQLDGGEVPRVVYRNPAAGFCVVVPEDWEMATGNAGNIEIAIDASTGASLQTQPAVWFFYAPHAPQQQAELLAQDLRQFNAATADVQRRWRGPVGGASHFSRRASGQNLDVVAVLPGKGHELRHCRGGSRGVFFRDFCQISRRH